MRELLIGKRPGHDAQGRGEHGQEDFAPIPARAVEAKDEAQEVNRQRRDPEEWDRRNVLANVIRHRKQQVRARRGQRGPQELPAARRWRLARGAHLITGGRNRCSGRPRGEAVPPGRRSQQSERDVCARPAIRLQARRHPGLERERISEERQHRCQIGKREQTIRALSRKTSGKPRLYERTGRRQQEVRQAYGRREEAENEERRILAAERLPLRAGHDGQQRTTQSEQRDVQPSLPSGGQATRDRVRIRVAQEQHRLEEHQAGRPHRRRSSEPRQDLLGHDRLQQEKQKRAEKDRRCVEGHECGPASRRRHPRRQRALYVD